LNLENTKAQNPFMKFYQNLEGEIQKLAHKYTIEYMSNKNFDGRCDYQHIMEVYKILIFPDDVLKNYLNMLGLEEIKAEYKKLVKMIHPDKNHHQKSGIAFQKYSSIYECALKKIWLSHHF